MGHDRRERGCVEMDRRKDLGGPAGILQGGIIATLVDVAAGSTAALSGTELVATTEMTLHYLSPGRTGPIRAVGQLLGSSTRSFAVELRNHTLVVTAVGSSKPSASRQVGNEKKCRRSH